MQERTDWAVWAHGRLQGAIAAATLALEHVPLKPYSVMGNNLFMKTLKIGLLLPGTWSGSTCRSAPTGRYGRTGGCRARSPRRRSPSSMFP